MKKEPKILNVMRISAILLSLCVFSSFASKTSSQNVKVNMSGKNMTAFDDVPFEDIIKKFELYYDIVITVNNSKLMKYKFSGKFRQRDGVESALRTLRKVYYFTYIKDEENNNIVIR